MSSGVSLTRVTRVRTDVRKQPDVHTRPMTNPAAPESTGDKATLALMEKAYKAYAAVDIDTIVTLFADDVVFHIAGRHPLADDYSGPEAVLGYLATVSSISSDGGGFTVRSLLTSGTVGVALVEGTAVHQGRVFTRPIVHVFSVIDGRVAEFWDNPFDQHAEDDFWTTAIGEGARA